VCLLFCGSSMWNISYHCWWHIYVTASVLSYKLGMLCALLLPRRYISTENCKLNCTTFVFVVTGTCHGGPQRHCQCTNQGERTAALWSLMTLRV
jgi:hypothetical protein